MTVTCQSRPQVDGHTLHQRGIVGLIGIEDTPTVLLNKVVGLVHLSLVFTRRLGEHLWSFWVKFMVVHEVTIMVTLEMYLPLTFQKTVGIVIGMPVVFDD